MKSVEKHGEEGDSVEEGKKEGGDSSTDKQEQEEDVTTPAPSKEEKKPNNSTAENDDDDDDEVNVDEDVQPKIHITIHKSQPRPKPEEPSPDMFDYTFLDALFAMLDANNSDEIEPILCGYFYKIVLSLLNKVKTKLLHYILLRRKGDIFIKLLSCLQHHSLAQLLIELMQVKIVATKIHHHHGTSDGASGGLLSNNGKGFAFHQNGGNDSHSDDSSDDDDAVPQVSLSPDEAQMTEVLKARRQEVVAFLIEKLSSKNSCDFESCLNANAILSEMTDNDVLFEKLVEKENLQKLINNSCDIKNPNQAQALHVLTNIVKEFPNYERQIGEELTTEFQQTLSRSVADIIYTCLLMMRASDAQIGEAPLLEKQN